MKAVILMTTTLIEKSKVFYNKIGFNWQNYEQILFYNCKNTSVILKANSNIAPPSTKLFFVDNNKKIIDFDQNDKNQVQINEDLHSIMLRVISSSKEVNQAKQIIPVLRSKDILNTKNSLENLGQWKTEKHGNGPIHYSLSFDDFLVEIYPNRIEPKGEIEIVLSNFCRSFPEDLHPNIESNQTSTLDLDGRYLTLYNDDIT